MKIIINSSSMVPIYEQIVDQVKAQIISGELKEDDNLPSVRTLSKGIEDQRTDCKKRHMILWNRKDLRLPYTERAPMWLPPTKR